MRRSVRRAARAGGIADLAFVGDSNALRALGAGAMSGSGAQFVLIFNTFLPFLRELALERGGAELAIPARTARRARSPA